MKNFFTYSVLIAVTFVFWWMVYIFSSEGMNPGVFIAGFFALLFSGGLLSIPISKIMQEKRHAFVEEDFDLIMTTLDHVENIGEGGDFYYVHTKWTDPDGGAIFYFKSDYLKFDPTRFLQGKEIPVKISRQDYKKYVVDLSSLPTLAS